MQRLVMSSAQATAVVVQAAQEAAGGYVCSIWKWEWNWMGQ